MAHQSSQYWYGFCVASRISFDLSKSEKKTRNFLGPFLRQLREKRGLTQIQVAEHLQRGGWDCSRQVFAFIEDGSRILSDMELLAILHALDHDPADLRSAFEQFCKDFGERKKS